MAIANIDSLFIIQGAGAHDLVPPEGIKPLPDGLPNSA